MKQRIVFVDNLKALAIFTVVVGHVFWFSWNQYSDNIWFCLIRAYNMPMFFFLSGMFAKDDMTLRQLGKKAKLLLVPTVVVGGLYASLNDGIEELLYGGMHLGYWFLPTLFVMFSFFYVRCSLVRGLQELFCLRKRLKGLFDVVFVIGVLALIKLLGNYVSEDIYSLFCLRHILSYMIFFWLGFLLWQNKIVLASMLHKYVDLIYTISFLGFAVSVYYVYYSGCDASGLTRQTMMSLFSIPWLLIFFKKRSFGNGRIQAALSYVGTHSLEIYVLQYFLLPTQFQLENGVVGGGKLFASFSFGKRAGYGIVRDIDKSDRWQQISKADVFWKRKLRVILVTLQ